jgi:hypothetical protein
MGNVGWGTATLFDIPAYHDDSASAMFDNKFIGNIQADSGVTIEYVNNASGQTDASLFTPFNSTTTNISNAANGVNTTNKYARKQVLNTTTNQLLYAAGSGTTDAWLDSDGTSVITPS